MWCSSARWLCLADGSTAPAVSETYPCPAGPRPVASPATRPAQVRNLAGQRRETVLKPGSQPYWGRPGLVLLAGRCDPGRVAGRITREAGERMRVLVIEDHAEMAEMVAVGLRPAQMAVDVALDGPAGLERAPTADYDVILLCPV